MAAGGLGLGNEAAVGLRMMRAVSAIALVSLLALGVCASTASAAPLAMTFTEDRANVGSQLFDEAMFAAPATAPFAAQLDPGTGLITAGALQVPQFSTHIPDFGGTDVSVDFEIGTITGSFTQATGALTLGGTAGGTLTADGKECTVSTTPSPLVLSTAGNSGGTTNPRSGAPFTHGLSGAGAIAGQWTDMSATPVSPGDTTVCETVDGRIGGPGGIWLVQTGDVIAPAAPQLTSTDPASPGSSGTPRIRGAAEAGSTVRVYAGANCTGAPVATGSAAELGSPGIAVAVAPGVTAAFSATASDAADNGSACSAPISYTRRQDDGPPPPPSPACVVPQLVGKTLARAKTALREADCKLGKVRKPKRLKGEGRRVLVVKSSSPAAGAKPASGKVHLKLGPKS